MAINSLNASSHGFSGLASGINSQEMVEKLLSGTQMKIDKAGQKKTALQYKQQMYRDVAAKLRSLQTGFLSFTSKNNLLSNAFYNTMNATLSSPKGINPGFTVTASSGAQPGNVSMDYIKQLAQAYKEKTNFDASGKVEGSMSSKAAEELLKQYEGPDGRLTIKVGDKSIEFDNAAKTFAGKSAAEVSDIINKKIEAYNATAEPGQEIKAEARFQNNKFTIIADNPEEYIEIHGNKSQSSKNPSLAMKMFGNVNTLGGKGSFSSAIDTEKYKPEFVMDLDGRKQTIRLDMGALEKFSTSGNADDLVADINKSLKRSFGDAVSAKMENGKINFTAKSTSQRFTMTGSHQVMETLGISSGTSNKINTGMALKDLNFSNELQGEHFTFAINGVDFSYSGDTSLATVINDINSSRAGVKVTYIESEDRFTIENSETGEGMGKFELEQTEGNLLSVLFGMKGSGSASTSRVDKPITAETSGRDFIDEIRKGGKFRIEVNGKKYTIDIPEIPEELTSDQALSVFADSMNQKLKDMFGTMADGQQSIEFKMNPDTEKFSISSNNKSFSINIIDGDDDNNIKGLNSIGFKLDDSTQIKDGNVLLSETGIYFGVGSKIKIGNTEIDGTTLNGKSMKEIAETLQNALRSEGAANAEVRFDEKTAAFRFMGIDIPMDIVIAGGNDADNPDVNIKDLFGTEKLSFNQSAQSNATQVMQEAQNAIFMLNGTEITRNTNSFTIDGLTFNLTGVTNKRDEHGEIIEGKYEDPTQITITRDTDKIVDGFQEFLKLYNETIDYINDIYKADATYKKYEPLTAKQKEAMSDREIALWEEKSKEGLLRGDPSLGKILQTMREALYTKPEGSNIAIYDIGVGTSFYSKDGNFKETEDGALKAAIENDPEAIRNLMAGEGGIMNLLNDAISDATRSSYGNPGTLVMIAGSNTGDTGSRIYKQIKEIDTQLSSLENRYNKEYARYWKQFNSMEQMIQQMNVQSSWLSQQLGGM